MREEYGRADNFKGRGPYTGAALQETLHKGFDVDVDAASNDSEVHDADEGRGELVPDLHPWGI